MMTGIPQYQRASVSLHIWPQLLIITHLVKNSFSLPHIIDTFDQVSVTFYEVAGAQ